MKAEKVENTNPYDERTVNLYRDEPGDYATYNYGLNIIDYY